MDLSTTYLKKPNKIILIKRCKTLLEEIQHTLTRTEKKTISLKNRVTNEAIHQLSSKIHYKIINGSKYSELILSIDSMLAQYVSLELRQNRGSELLFEIKRFLKCDAFDHENGWDYITGDENEFIDLKIDLNMLSNIFPNFELKTTRNMLHLSVYLNYDLDIDVISIMSYSDISCSAFNINAKCEPQ